MGVTEGPTNNKVSVAKNNDKVDSIENLINVPITDKTDAIDNLVKNDLDARKSPSNNEADYLPREGKEILKSLASKWENVFDPNALQVTQLKGAMTNEVFQIKWQTIGEETSQKVLVRIYGEGTGIFFDRDDEVRTFEFISKSGQGPRLLGRFANGRIEEFINARTLSASDLRDPYTSALIAAKLKEFHDLKMPGPKNVQLWDTLRIWLAEARRLSFPEEVETFHLDTMDKEISILEKELSGTHQCIRFCHNDLQYVDTTVKEMSFSYDAYSEDIIKRNFLVLSEVEAFMALLNILWTLLQLELNCNKVDGRIMLLQNLVDKALGAVQEDYEYASYNPVAYDIANHFSEMAANYHTNTPHILDYSKYPDLEERRIFVRTYLSSSGEQPNNSEVEQLLDEIEKYTLANHLFWGMWGIISEHVNDIDFDYKEYAKQRFQEYWLRKHLMSLDGSSYDNVTNGELALTPTPKGTPRKKPRKFRMLKFF